MLKTITRQLFARLNRHLPYRLVHRDPLPGAQTAVNATIPPSLSAASLFLSGAGCAYYAFPLQSQAFIFAFLREVLV